MFSLNILLSKYLFLLYIIFFIYNSCLYLLSENKIIRSKNSYLSRLRIIIIFTHITAFLIISYIKDTYSFDIPILIFAGVSILIFIIGFVCIDIFYKKSCHLMWNIIFFLTDIGVITLSRLNFDLAKKQLIWIVMGLICAFVIPYIIKILPRLDLFKNIYLTVGLVLLIATILFGNEEGGATNWLTIRNITFQPSEAVKLLFIFYLSCCFSNNPNIKHIILPTAVSSIFILCLVFQTDLGSALIFFMTFMTILYIGTSNIILTLSGFSAAAAASVIAYNMFAHVRTRVLIWKNPWAEIEVKGYQIAQSLFAIGTKGFFGSGLTKGFPKSIPVVEKDFIFSAICEEFGVIFAILVICLFILLFYCMVMTSLKSNNRFLTILSAGITSMICFQTFLILGGVVKFIPLTGVTLPFISYGGSSIIINFVILGLIQWIHIRNKNA